MFLRYALSFRPTPMLRLIIILLILPATLLAQRESTTVIGFGNRSQWDTYLSDERYHGSALTLITQKNRPTHWFDRRLYVQHTTQGDLAYCAPRSDKHKSISGFFHWQVAWQYHLLGQNTTALSSATGNQWELNIGPALQTNLGIVYNTLGGNNPASARASIHVAASAQARRHFHLSRHRFTATLQADIPLSGIMFSPEYGESYYEISSNNSYSHNICYANPFKALQADVSLSVDWHLKPTTSFRLGYGGQFRQSDVNNIKTQDFSHYLLIGYSRRF